MKQTGLWLKWQARQGNDDRSHHIKWRDSSWNDGMDINAENVADVFLQQVMEILLPSVFLLFSPSFFFFFFCSEPVAIRRYNTLYDAFLMQVTYDHHTNECVWYKLCASNGQKIALGCCYKPPRASSGALCDLSDIAASIYDDTMIVGGDFNLLNVVWKDKKIHLYPNAHNYIEFLTILHTLCNMSNMLMLPHELSEIALIRWIFYYVSAPVLYATLKLSLEWVIMIL